MADEPVLIEVDADTGDELPGERPRQRVGDPLQHRVEIEIVHRDANDLVEQRRVPLIRDRRRGAITGMGFGSLIRHRSACEASRAESAKHTSPTPSRSCL